MKLFSSLVALCSVLSVYADAASVAWGVLEERERWQDGNVLHVVYAADWAGGLDVFPMVGMSVERTTRPIGIAVSGDSTRVDLEHCDNWVVFGAGDVADKESTRENSSCFLHTGLDGNDYVADQVVSSLPGTFQFYLAFASAASNCWFSDGEVPRYGEVYYGWVLFECRGFDISLVDSAICLEPNVGIVVGTDITAPVPEPATGALAIWGASVLLRRRMHRGGRRRA